MISLCTVTLRKASLSTLFILNRPVLMQNSVDTDENASTDSLYIDIFLSNRRVLCNFNHSLGRYCRRHIHGFF